MVGYCDQCGCAIYTLDDVGFDEVIYQLLSMGVIPYVKFYYAPVRVLLCKACIEEAMEVPYCAIEAAFQALAEQECKI